jgi:hypothetical protein
MEQVRDVSRRSLLGSAVRIGGLCLFWLGVALILVDISGIFFPNLISPKIFRSGYIDTQRKMSARDCWEQLARRQGESDSVYLARAYKVVDDAHIHTDRRHLFLLENWMMYAFSKIYPPAEYTQDADRIIRSGGALCGQVALVLMDACRKNGIEARQIGLNGHVILEAKTENGWQIYDSDYGIMLPMSLADAERPENKERITRIYLDAGHHPDDVSNIVGFYQTASDNVTMPLYGQLCPRIWIIERTTEYLKWIVPVFFVLAGGAALPSVRTKARRFLRLRSS